MSFVIQLLKKFLSFIGFPSKEGWKTFLHYLDEMRFLVTIYIILIVLYTWFFRIKKSYTIIFFSKAFGLENKTDFGVSFSASVLDDLLMFILLTMAALIISIKLSTKNPEDEIFDNRIRALMNGRNVKNNDVIFNYLKEQISLLLVLNKVIRYEAYIKEYHEKEQAYTVLIKRVQVMTNACKDRDFKPIHKPLTIETDTEVNKAHGVVKFLG